MRWLPKAGPHAGGNCGPRGEAVTCEHTRKPAVIKSESETTAAAAPKVRSPGACANRENLALKWRNMSICRANAALCSLRGVSGFSEFSFTRRCKHSVEALLKVRRKMELLETANEQGRVILGAVEIRMKLKVNDGGLGSEYVASGEALQCGRQAARKSERVVTVVERSARLPPLVECLTTLRTVKKGVVDGLVKAANLGGIVLDGLLHAWLRSGFIRFRSKEARGNA